MKRAYLICVLALFICTGCQFSGYYHQNYLPADQTMGEAVPGKGLILTEVSDDNYDFKAGPTSLTGSATQLGLPLGVITREIARVVFGRVFADGVDHSNELKNPTSYKLIIKPRTVSLEYRYNQLRNLGFAVTPQVNIRLEVTLLDNSKKILLRKNYDSGYTSGDTYFVSGAPGENVNRAVHKVLYQLLKQAVTDAQTLLRNAPAS